MSDDSKPSPGMVRTANGKLKRLVQVWVSDRDYGGLSSLAQERMLPMATYLRQIIFAHIEAQKAAKRERKAIENG